MFGLIDSFAGRFFWQHQTARFTADAYQSFLQTVLERTDQPLIVLQDGAAYHTAVALKPFLADHRDRLTVYQLPGYSPDYNPIEHLWKNIKKRSTHLRYFPTFEDLTVSVEEGLAFSHQHPEAVRTAIGTTLEHLGEETHLAA